MAGAAFTTQPVVVVQDAYGNSITSGADGEASLTISLVLGTGSLLGTTTAMATLGVSSWSDLSIDAFGSKALQVNKPDLTASGGTGPLSVTSSSFDNATNPPSVPTGLGANGGNNVVTLSWTASSGATSYNILRGTSADSLAQLATNNANSYTDTTASNGMIYFYAVQASSPGGTSASSSNVQAGPLSVPSINPLMVNNTVGAGTLVISWSASTGASNYQVKYATTSGSASSGITGCTVTTLTCTITRLTSGTTYYFSVNAINTYFGSVNSFESSGTPREKRPQAFTIISATQGNAQVALEWESSTGATSYTVKYGTSSNSYTSTFATNVTGTSSTVTGLTNGTTYYFMVTAINPGGSQDASTEFVRTPAQPTLSTISSSVYDSANTQVVTPALASNWSASLRFTLGGAFVFHLQ